MDTQLKAKWIEALRSGQYQQGGRYLKFEDRFCCLGVLCDVQEVDFEDLREQFGTLSIADSAVEYFGGLGRVQAVKLASMNDAGKSFSEIADYIEKNI